MQIKFEAQKLKEANEYVNLLNPKKEQRKKSPQSVKKTSIFKRVLGFFFR